MKTDERRLIRAAHELANELIACEEAWTTPADAGDDRTEAAARRIVTAECALVEAVLAHRRSGTIAFMLPVDEGRYVRYTDGYGRDEVGRVKRFDNDLGRAFVVFYASDGLDAATYVDYTAAACDYVDLRFVPSPTAEGRNRD